MNVNERRWWKPTRGAGVASILGPIVVFVLGIVMAVHVSLSKQDRVTDAVNESIIRMTADAMFAQKKSEGTYPKTPLSSSGDYLIIGQQAPVPVRFGSGNTASGGEVTVWVKDSTDVLCITVNSPNADEVSAEVSPARSGNDITITYVTACEPTR